MKSKRLLLDVSEGGRKRGREKHDFPEVPRGQLELKIFVNLLWRRTHHGCRERIHNCRLLGEQLPARRYCGHERLYACGIGSVASRGSSLPFRSIEVATGI